MPIDVDVSGVVKCAAPTKTRLTPSPKKNMQNSEISWVGLEQVPLSCPNPPVVVVVLVLVLVLVVVIFWWLRFLFHVFSIGHFPADDIVEVYDSWFWMTKGCINQLFETSCYTGLGSTTQVSFRVIKSWESKHLRLCFKWRVSLYSNNGANDQILKSRAVSGAFRISWIRVPRHQ